MPPPRRVILWFKNVAPKLAQGRSYVERIRWVPKEKREQKKGRVDSVVAGLRVYGTPWGSEPPKGRKYPFISLGPFLLYLVS